jgi:hypothetical protein
MNKETGMSKTWLQTTSHVPFLGMRLEFLLQQLNIMLVNYFACISKCYFVVWFSYGVVL